MVQLNLNPQQLQQREPAQVTKPAGAPEDTVTSPGIKKPGFYGEAPELTTLRQMGADRRGFTAAADQTQARQEQADAAERQEMGAATQDFANFDPFDDETLDKLTRLSFAEQADGAAAKFMDQMGGVASTLGAAGITGGGVAAGFAAQAASDRFQTIVTGQRRAMTDLASRQMEMRSAKKMAELEARTRYASVLGKDVPTTNIEALQNMLELDMANLGLFVNRQAAKDASKEANKGAMLGLAGNLAGGFMSAVL